MRDRAACRSIYDILLPKHDAALWTGGFYAGSTARSLGILGAALDLPEVRQWIEAALRIHKGIESPTWAARTHLDWAEQLVEQGQPDAARSHALEALEEIGDLDLTASRRRAERVLGMTGRAPVTALR